MFRLSEKEIELGVKEIFSPISSVRVDVVAYGPGEYATIEVEQMYEYIDCSLKDLLKLAELMGTMNINIDEEFMCGCETCDYGSSYTKTFYIKAE